MLLLRVGQLVIIEENGTRWPVDARVDLDEPWHPQYQITAGERDDEQGKIAPAAVELDRDWLSD
jgi:hypothetical protein